MLARALILALVFGTLGCAPRATAPFHIYGSPVLRARNYDAARQSSRALAARASDTPIRDVYELPSPSRAIAHAKTPRPKNTRPKRRASRAPRLPAPRADTSLPTLSTKARAPQAVARPKTSAGQRADAAAQFVWDTLKDHDVGLSRHARLHVPKLYRTCKKSGKILFSSSSLVPGAVVFFHNTFDANGDHRNNDWYTHVALVTQRQGHEVTLVAYQHSGVQTFSMNLKKPATGAQLRPRHADDVPYTQYRAAELFAGACHPKGMRPIKEPDMAWTP